MSPSTPTAQVAALHERAFIADGHADSLMWNRDLTVASNEGHVDFPRLRQAGVKLQCFTLVTRGFPFINGFPLFARYRRWPSKAIGGEWARTCWQLDRLDSFCQRSSGQVATADNAKALEENRRAGRLSAVIGIEGAHAIEGRVERVRELHSRGVRFMSLTHLSNNELGGSSSPLMGDRPLTELGHAVLEEMASTGMSVDVAHASPKVLDEIFAHPSARPFCSHAGVRGATELWRNLSDETLRKIADKGGVVGIIFGTVFLGGKGFDDLARHIEHAIKIMGEDGVALGSDFDGMVPLPKGMRDVRDLPLLTQTLLRRGHPEARVEKILGENFYRFFRETLGPVRGS